MKWGLYLRLAGTNIKNSKKIYLPYILTGICMIMIYYIMSFLAADADINAMPGGDSLQQIMWLGICIIGIFSCLFLFYTNSFIIKRRKREFGLYNILGMEKRHIGKILFCENSIIALLSLALGLLTGVLFSKLTQLFLLRLMNEAASFHFYIEWELVLNTICVFAAIFALILLSSLYQLWKAKPVDLLQGSVVGEKEPRANWIMAVLGIVLLGAGYWLAISVEDALSALVLFFVAVILVILGTYCCFISGSVALLKLLKKNKRYYYKSKHFISVSSMTYRMKRNGAGLANICILSTMVLVMLSSVTCLYIGAEDALRNRYPRDIVIDTYTSMPDDAMLFVKEDVQTVLEEKGLEAEDVLEYRYYSLVAYQSGANMLLDSGLGDVVSTQICSIYLLPLEDYNAITGSTQHLDKGQALLSVNRMQYHYDTVCIGGQSYQIKEKVPNFFENGNATSEILCSLYIVVPELADIETLHSEVMRVSNDVDDGHFLRYFYGFNLDCAQEEQQDVYAGIREQLKYRHFTGSVECIAQERSDFFSLYTGLFFLGIILGLAFILATVLIMYYKQITEGYEDQSRFDIMQKVGLTKQQIRKSIDSQILTVFFLPLLTAVVHTMFAFPMVEKLLLLFGLDNTRLFLLVTALSFVVFALFYSIVYFITSRNYYSIVSGKNVRRVV